MLTHHDIAELRVAAAPGPLRTDRLAGLTGTVLTVRSAASESSTSQRLGGAGGCGLAASPAESLSARAGGGGPGTARLPGCQWLGTIRKLGTTYDGNH